MAKTLTLEEAAQKLGQTPEQFKTNLKTHKDFRSIRPLMGGATMHFRAQDIDELARRLGMGSDPELKMGDAASGADSPQGNDDQIEIGREPQKGGSSVRIGGSAQGNKRSPAPRPQADVPLVTDSSEDFVPLTGDQSKSRTPDSSAKVRQRDSDAKLEKKSGSRPGGEHAKSSDVFGLAEEPKSGAKSKSGVRKGVDNEFELKLTPDSSDEVDLGSAPRDVSGKKGGSGVKLNAPADSGISLEKDSDSEFELNMDSTSSAKLGSSKKSSLTKKTPKPDSDSEFELTLDDSSSEIAPLDSSSGPQSDKDIFETDFDIPALDDESGSEAVALDESDTDLESSDFDLAVEEGATESGSEVVEVDEGVEAVEDEAEAVAEVDEEGQPSRVVTAGPAKWGPLPAIVLGICFPIMLIVTMMSYELVHGMWGFHQPSNRPTSAVTRGIASIFNSDSELPKEP
jgi:hypothetical protein